MEPEHLSWAVCVTMMHQLHGVVVSSCHHAEMLKVAPLKEGRVFYGRKQQQPKTLVVIECLC
jgi:hypothetical protein